MRPNEKLNRMRCTDCGSIQIVSPRLRRISPCPVCYSSRYVKVKQPKPPKEVHVTSPAAVSQDIEYYPMAQKVIRSVCKRFDVHLARFGMSLTPDQLLEMGPITKELRHHILVFERLLEELGLPLEQQQEDQ